MYCSDLSATRTKLTFPYQYKFGATFDKVLLLYIVHLCDHIASISIAKNDVNGIHIHVLMRDEMEGRKKQASSNKQGKATQHTQGSHFSKEK